MRLLVFAQSRFEFFSSLFLSEAVCSTGDPILIFKKDSESSNVVLQNVYLGFLIKYYFIPENSSQILSKTPERTKVAEWWRAHGG